MTSSADDVALEDFEPRSDFPLAALPDWVGDYVVALAYVLQVEPSAVALSVLGATAIAVQGKAELVVRGGWVEPLSYWTLVALRSGNRKTPALHRPLAPLREYERIENRLRESYRERIGDLRAAKHEGGKKRDTGESCPYQAALPPRLELFGSDVTPESLAVALAEQQESYAIVTDEPTSLAEILGGLYSDGRKPNTGVYMAGYSGSTYRRRRLKNPSATLERPALSMLLIGQPGVFDDITSKSMLIDLGFVGRFLVCKPRDNLGARKIHDESVPEAVAAAYTQHFQEILSVPPAEPLPNLRIGWINDPPPPWPTGAQKRHRLEMTPEARAFHSACEAAIEPLLAEAGALGELSDFGAKLSGLIARSATLLHVLEHPATWHETPVGLESLAHGAEIGRFALGEVLRIWSPRAEQLEQEELVDYVLRRAWKMVQEGPAAVDGVSWTQLCRTLIQGNGRGRIRSREALAEVLEALVSEGELEIIQGARSRRYRVKHQTH